MARALSSKLRPPRKRVDAIESPIDETPFYIKLLNTKEIEDFKHAFPNMVDFIAPDGRVHLPVSPDVRLRSIYAYHDKQTANQYLMRMLHKFRMRGMTLDQIAQLFDVDTRTVARWHKELKQQFITNFKEVEIHHLVGETLEYFNEIGQTAMREMDSATNPSHKARLMDTAIKAKESSINFLEKTGFFTTNQLTPSDKHDESRQAAIDIQQALVDILNPAKSTEEFALEVLGEGIDIQKLREQYRHVIEG